MQKKDRQPAWKKKESHRVGPLEVEVRNNDISQALKVLKHKMSVEGVLTELKKRRFAEKPSEKKRRKHREALKKARKSRGRKVRQRRNTTRKKSNG
jgi:small subunit ribosomal protein S21